MYANTREQLTLIAYVTLIELLPLVGRGAQALANLMPENQAWCYLLCRAKEYQGITKCLEQQPEIKAIALSIAIVDSLGLALILILSELMRRLNQQNINNSRDDTVSPSLRWGRVLIGILAAVTTIFAQASNGIADAITVFGGTYAAAISMATVIACFASISGGRYASTRYHDLTTKAYWPKGYCDRVSLSMLFLLGTAIQMLNNFYQNRRLLVYWQLREEITIYGAGFLTALSLINNTLVQGRSLGRSWVAPHELRETSRSFYQKLITHPSKKTITLVLGVAFLEFLNAISALTSAAILFNTLSLLVNDNIKNDNIFFYTTMTIGVLFGSYFAWLNRVSRLVPMQEHLALLFLHHPVKPAALNEEAEKPLLMSP